MAGFVGTTQRTVGQAENKTGADGECLVLEVSGINNTHDVLVSAAASDLVCTIAHGVVLPVFLLVCVPTNIINAIVFYKHGLRQRINLCLFTLSLVDLLYPLQAFCFSYSDKLYNYLTGGPNVGAVSWFFSKHDVSPIGLFYLNTLSWFISTLIAGERCFCVVSPLTSKTVLKTKSSAAILLLSSVVILAGGFLVGMKWGAVCVIMQYMNGGGGGGGGVLVQDRPVAGDNTSTDVITSVLYLSTPATTTTTITGTSTTSILTITFLTSYPSQFYLQHTQLIDMLDIFVYGMTIPFFCFTVVIATTIVTMVKLRNTAAWRGRSSSLASTVTQNNKETALTRMLVGTSVLFIVLAAPVVLVRVGTLILPDFNMSGRYEKLFFNLMDMSIACCYINSSVNFFVYYRLGTRFRRSVNDLFGMTSKHKTQLQMPQSVVCDRL